MASKLGILFACAIVGLTTGRISASPVIAGASSSAGSYASSGAYGGAYGGSYGPGFGSGYSSGVAPAPIPPIPIQVLPAQPFDYAQLQSKYFESLAKHFQQSGSVGAPHFLSSSSSILTLPPAAAEPNVLNQQFAAQHAAIQQSIQQALQQSQSQGGGYGNPGSFNSYPSGGGGYQGGYQPVSAVATAALGPQGGFQTAQLTPANPNSPNVEQRFGAEEGTQPGGGGTYSVFTSSVSGSSDLNGKKNSFRKAQTTVNNNGKVTTYTVQDP